MILFFDAYLLFLTFLNNMAKIRQFHGFGILYRSTNIQEDIEMGIISSYLNTAFGSLNAQQAQQTQNAKATEGTKRPSFGAMTNPNQANNAERTPEQDTFSTESAVKVATTAMMHMPALYLMGFALGFCPALTILGVGAFLFANKNNDSFKQMIAQTVATHKDIMSQLGKMNQPQQAQQAQQTQPAEQPKAAEEAKVTNPIQQTEQPKEEKELSPLDRAQIKFAKAQANQQKAAATLARREEAQKVAEEKVELAQARLDKAQADYDKAKAEVKTQMTDKMMRLQQNLSVKEANVAVAREKADVARALLQEAEVKVENARVAFEDLKAEEIVDID